MQTDKSSTLPDGKYVGTELEVFQFAVNWKNTLTRHIQPYLSGDVLEVGAGIGGSTLALQSGRETSWTCLEPDAELADCIRKSIKSVKVITGTTRDLGERKHFDTIIYIDVLEHIKDDRAEIMRASNHLRPGGQIVVLCPAHQSLYSPFDQAIGHFRRYNKQSLQLLRPEDLMEVDSRYLDSAGLLASIMNRLWLSQEIPTQGQIAFWDKILVRISRVLDFLLRYRVGKSVLIIWRKKKPAQSRD